MLNLKHSKKFYFILPLLAALVITGCGKGCGKSSGESTSNILKLLPSGKNVIVGINWEELNESPFGDKLKESIPEEFRTLSEEIGNATLALNVQNMGQGPQDEVAIISGSFKPEKVVSTIEEQAQKAGKELQTSDYEGIKLYVLPSAGKEETAAFIEKNLVIGKKPAVQQVIDLSKGKGESIEKDKNLMDLIKSVDTKRMLWAVAIVPEGAMGNTPAAQPGNPFAALSGVKSLDLALDLSKELNLDLGIIAGSPEDAKQMETMANSYKTLFGASLAQQDPNLGKVFNNLNITVNDKRVALNLKLDEATVAELSKKATENSGAGMPTPEAAAEAPAPAPEETKAADSN